MSRKIAPTLTRHIMEGGTITPLDGLEEARDELRALLAVARAAEDHSHADVPYDPVDETHVCPICRALARLRRASERP